MSRIDLLYGGLKGLVDGISAGKLGRRLSIAVLFETMRIKSSTKIRCAVRRHLGNYLFKKWKARNSFPRGRREALDNGTVPDADKAFFADFMPTEAAEQSELGYCCREMPPEELARSLNHPLVQDSEKVYWRYVEEQAVPA